MIFGSVGAGLLAGQMPFLSPIQQNQSSGNMQKNSHIKSRNQTQTKGLLNGFHDYGKWQTRQLDVCLQTAQQHVHNVTSTCLLAYLQSLAPVSQFTYYPKNLWGLPEHEHFYRLQSTDTTG